MPYRDRSDAGQALAAHLGHLRDADPLVLGLARGGVPVAAEVARALGAPLDVMVARKLGAPTNPEFGIGAVAPGGVRVLDEASVRALDVTDNELDQLAHDESLEVERRLLLYRGDARPPDVERRTVILVDDGLATGVTARAAIASLRKLGAARVVLAVPVGAPDSVAALQHVADEVVCPEQPLDFRAVGLWYDEFEQTSDEEVVKLLGPRRREVRIDVAGGQIVGDLVVPSGAVGLVIFAHGSGSGRHSTRNRAVARQLNAAGLATLLLDLLTPREEDADLATREHRFDIGLLAARLQAAIAWARAQDDLGRLNIGLFGASTGAAAALVAASGRPADVAAVVSRGGRPDLAGPALHRVWAPTLLVVGGEDAGVIELNEEAFEQIPGPKRMAIVPGASHLFEEAGALEQVAGLAAPWFTDHLAARAPLDATRGFSTNR